ncbi:MAG TPA: hypothetical protein DEQ61_09325, partial [Streptomyces sp.]|nr:hypothetical protein [Streptomyces sp.]
MTVLNRISAGSTAAHSPAPRRRLTARTARLGATGVLAGVLLAITPQIANAAGPPSPAAPDRADLGASRQTAADPDTLITLSDFFAREGAVARAEADPRIEGSAVPVHMLSADFVAAEPGTVSVPVANLEFYASRAVSSDGQEASVWTARTGAGWTVVNIATGDDETRYAAAGARKLRGGTVFREPQIDAWYVQRGNRVLPLDKDATRAVGKDGSSLTAYQKRVHAAYADKLPGSAYDKKGKAGGYGPGAGQPDAPPPAAGAP